MLLFYYLKLTKFWSFFTELIKAIDVLTQCSVSTIFSYGRVLLTFYSNNSRPTSMQFTTHNLSIFEITELNIGLLMT